jgi:hypothetical protein
VVLNSRGDGVHYERAVQLGVHVCRDITCPCDGTVLSSFVVDWLLIINNGLEIVDSIGENTPPPLEKSKEIVRHGHL